MFRVLLLLIAMLHLNYALAWTSRITPKSLLQTLGQQKPSHLFAAAAFMGILTTASPVLDSYAQEPAQEEEIEQAEQEEDVELKELLVDWHKTAEVGILPHQRAIFYLLPKAPQLRNFFKATYVAQIAYLGAEPEGGSRFIVIRLSMLAADTPFGKALHEEGFSLFSPEGLVNDDVKVVESKVFPSPVESPGGTFDIVIITLPDIDLPDLQPVQLEAYPPVATKLQMLSYWPDEEKEPLPIRWRECSAGKLSAKLQLAYHSCLSPFAIHSFGAPIFNANTDTPTLVGFYLWSDKDTGPKAATLSDELLNYVSDVLAVMRWERGSTDSLGQDQGSKVACQCVSAKYRFT